MGTPRRVVITGMGLISPLGNSPAALWDALQAGRSGVVPLTSLPADDLPFSFGGEAREFTGDIEDFGPLEKEQKKAIRKSLKLMSRETQMGVAAAQLALTDWGFELGKHDPDATGIVFGSDYMMSRPEDFIAGVSRCLDAEHKFHLERWPIDGLPQVTPLWLLKNLPNMPASHVAIYNDLRGPNNSITVREASSNLALGEAFRTITRGSAETILSGATGCRLHPTRVVHALLQEEVAKGNERLPAEVSRPFDVGHNGQVLGEGAAAVVLQTLESARSQGKKIWGEVLGIGSSQVADQRRNARRDIALANAIRGALRDADVGPESVGHIHAHGLSTRSCDADETRAIHQVFADKAPRVPVVAAKSYFGNLGAASGLIELIGSMLALEHGRLFRTLNYRQPDPDCPLHVVTDPSEKPGDSVLNLSVTPQGQASAILVRAFRG